MCWNGDFYFDGFDGMDDPDDDFQEDMLDESEHELGELDMAAEVNEPCASEPADPGAAFDFQEAFILGGMIVGQGYEEALDDDKGQQEQQNNGDDGEDLI